MTKGFVVVVSVLKENNHLFTEAAEAKFDIVNECFPAVQEKQ